MKRTVLYTSLGILIGAVSGYLYYHFYGCTNGCSITGSPINSTLYGSFMGGLLVNTFKKDNKQEQH
ncbi:MAG: hypothetical protein IPI91_09920 [Flavobacteriales bacterium]|nr:hypothetical protein [Flavobacteriales bacterium]